MLRILLDQNAPRGLKSIAGYEMQSAFAMGWAELSNGVLIAAAEAAGFDAMVTGDKNIEHQQNLTGRKLALIVLQSNVWPVVKTHLGRVEAALRQIAPGAYITVSFPRPRLNRRVWSGIE